MSFLGVWVCLFDPVGPSLVAMLKFAFGSSCPVVLVSIGLGMEVFHKNVLQVWFSS